MQKGVKEMDEKYSRLIESLAAKLGTTVEHLWGVLIKQAPISGTTSLVMCIIFILLVVWLWIFVKGKTTKPLPTENDRYPTAEWNGEAAALAWILVSIAVILSSIYVISSVQEITAAFLNPEYWALKQLRAVI